MQGGPFLEIELSGSPLKSLFSGSISELKKNPSQLIERAGGEAVAVSNHNKPTAYLIPAEAYEWMSNLIEDQELRAIIEEREAKPMTQPG